MWHNPPQHRAPGLTRGQPWPYRGAVYNDVATQACILAMGLLWSTAYLLIIRRAAVDRAPGMPLVALCANCSWEVVFGWVYPDAPPMVWVNRVWFLLDLIILSQYLRYGKRELPSALPGWVFVPSVVLTAALSYWVVIGAVVEFEDWDGRYTAWAGNLLMSGQFISMLVRRNSLAGQSLPIALAKLGGTLFADIAQSRVSAPTQLMMAFYVSTFLLDSTYVVMVIRKARQLGVNPWRT